MILELYFTFLFVLAMIFVIIGNYVYHKAVHALNVPHAFLPSEQFKHLRKYKELLEAQDKHPWYMFFLKSFKVISYIFIILFITLIVLLFLLQPGK